MTPICQCGQPAPDAFLCRRCASVLERILAELPATLDDLQTTITRQSRTSKGGGGKPTKASEAPLPFDVHASEVLDRTRNGMSTWIRHVCEVRGVPLPAIGDPLRPASNGAMATWLVTHIQSILADEWAPQLLADLKQLQYELRAAVDNREYRYAGPCTAVLQMGEVYEVSPDVVAIRPTTRETCGAPLRVRTGGKTITCRTCGAEYDLAERMVTVLAKIRGEMATGQDAAYLLSDALQTRITWASIRKMEHAGHVAFVTTDDEDRKLYLIGDILDVLARRLNLVLPEQASA